MSQKPIAMLHYLLAQLAVRFGHTSDQKMNLKKLDPKNECVDRLVDLLWQVDKEAAH